MCDKNLKKFKSLDPNLKIRTRSETFARVNITTINISYNVENS
jgi:hypothetical protein